MHRFASWISLAAVGTGALFLGGCSQIVSRTIASAIEAVEKESSGSKPAYPQRSASWQDDGEYIKSLAPVNSGAGLIVFEPVATGANPQMANFGAGCGRWLHLHVGGQSALGKTPLWGQIEDARVQVKSPNLRLTEPKARELAQSLGVTHFAVGTIEPRGNGYRLRYKLVSAKDGKPQGQPIQLEGTAAKVLGSLPTAARQMATRLGVSSPKLPAKINVSFDEMKAMGQVPWKSVHTAFPAAQVTALRRISEREPLAGLLYQRSGAELPKAQWQPVIKNMLAHSPENALLLADLGWRWAPLNDEQEALLNNKAAKHPNNFLMAVARMTRHRSRNERAEEQKAAEQAARCSPQNSLAWNELGSSFANQASDVRRGRFSSALSESETSYIHALYPRALAAHEKATAVNPRSSISWHEMARAAVFAGERSLAEEAIWKAIELNPGNASAYEWGFQMYQNKWGGTREQLLKVAETAVANAHLMQCPTREMIEALRADDMKQEVEPLLAKAVAKNPRDYEALYELGALAHYYERDYGKAEKMYRQAIAARPSYALALSSLGDLHEHTKGDSLTAVKLYRRAIEIDPTHGYYHANLAASLHTLGRQEEAMAEAGQAIRYGYKDAGHTMWGRLGLSP